MSAHDFSKLFPTRLHWLLAHDFSTLFAREFR
jgi:hypothetical protein